jgi:hypothetical protein
MDALRLFGRISEQVPDTTVRHAAGKLSELAARVHFAAV